MPGLSKVSVSLFLHTAAKISLNVPSVTNIGLDANANNNLFSSVTGGTSIIFNF